jgi:hypothetical protein
MATYQRLEQVTRVFFSRHMGGDLVFELITTRCLRLCLDLGYVHLTRCGSQVLYQGTCNL